MEQPQFSQLEIGKFYRFDYPTANYSGVRRTWEERLVLVTGLRNLDERPLEPVTYEMNPLLMRGSLLIFALDLDKAASRTFYRESMREVREVTTQQCTILGPCRVVLLEEDSDPEEIFRGPGSGAIAFLRGFLKERLPPGLLVAIEPLAEAVAA